MTTVDFVFGTPPFAHQLAELERTWDAVEWAYFWEQGTGKTKLVIDRCANMFLARKLAGAIVVSMNGPHADFVKEGTRDHWPREVRILPRIYRSGMGKRATAHFEEALLPAEGVFRLASFNYESLRTKSGMTTAIRFIKSVPGPVMAVADESDLIKTPSAAQTRAAWNIARRCRYTVIMTGTEVTEGPLDLYSQTQFLRPGILGCPNFITYKHHYAEWKERVILTSSGERRFPELVRYRNLDELKQRLSAFSSSLKKKDCMDLPEKIPVRRTVILGPEQRAAYDRVRERVLAEFETGELTTEHALTKLLRLAQIVGGFLPLDSGDLLPLPNAKLGMMLRDIEAVPREDGIIVWARFVAELNLIVETISKMGIGSVARYWGEISPQDRTTEAEEFKAGARRIMVAQQQAGGRGHTWLRGTHVFYFSNSYSWSQRAQSEDRPHRIGQTENVTYYDYLAEGTVDEKILNALLAKRNIAEFFKDRSSLKEFLS